MAFTAALLARAPQTATAQQETTVPHHATGTFEVRVTPQQPEPALADTGIARLLLDKKFHGDLEATSQGQMLAFGGPQKGSGGYVAIERVSGTLAGRTGAFALQHSGTMQPAGTHLTITVIPDSGTDGLQGIAGSMNIIIEAGKHSYTFDYTLPAPR